MRYLMELKADLRLILRPIANRTSDARTNRRKMM
jgi:hypothetical protein